MKPTKEQLADPKWWDENASPEDKYCYHDKKSMDWLTSWHLDESMDRYELLAKRPDPVWVPVLGSVCEIAASTEYLKISHKEGLKVKIYSRFIDDRGVTLFAFVAINGSSGGVVTAECLRPIKTQREKLIDLVATVLQTDDQDVTELCNKSKSIFMSGATKSVDAILARFVLTEKDGE